MKLMRALASVCLLIVPVSAESPDYFKTVVHNTPTAEPDERPRMKHAIFRPFVELSTNLNGAGFSPMSAQGSTGIAGNSAHFLYYAEAHYDNAKKTDDGSNSTGGLNHGHTTGMSGTVAYRFASWYAGAGAQIGRTFTTDYNKQSVYAKAGLGKDFRGGFPARFQAMYMLPAFNERTTYPDGTSCKCSNGGKGVNFHMWLPSLESNSHFVYHMEYTAIYFHTTITDPNNPFLVKLQGSQHAMDSFLSFGFLTRW